MNITLKGSHVLLTTAILGIFLIATAIGIATGPIGLVAAIGGALILGSLAVGLFLYS